MTSESIWSIKNIYIERNIGLWVLDIVIPVGTLKVKNTAIVVVFVFQVGLYLKEYIKIKKLWDVYNPLIAHCAGDPLERVFGVKSFTPYDAK